jgi:transketolase
MRYGSEAIDHRVFVICSDGDLMEGMSAEAASLAGHLGLDRLVYLYDDNRITIDGDTGLSFTEDVCARFEAYGWHTSVVQDANDMAALTTAIEEAIGQQGRPSLIRVRSVIGYPAPTKQGTPAAHGSPLGEDEVRATKLALGWDPDLTFHVPDPVRAHFATAGERGAAARRSWGDPPTSSSRRGRRCPTEAGLAVRARAPTCTGACASTRWAPA